MDTEEYSKECGLSFEEWQLERAIDVVRKLPTLEAIVYLKQFITVFKAGYAAATPESQYKNALQEIIYTTASKAYTPFQKVNRCYDVAAFALSPTPEPIKTNENE